DYIAVVHSNALSHLRLSFLSVIATGAYFSFSFGFVDILKALTNSTWDGKTVISFIMSICTHTCRPFLPVILVFGIDCRPDEKVLVPEFPHPNFFKRSSGVSSRRYPLDCAPAKVHAQPMEA